MTIRGLSRIAAAVGLVALCAGNVRAQDLESVLKQTDAGSVKFKSAQADLRREIYERVVKDTTTQTGSTYYLRVGSGIQVGMKLNPPSEQVVEIKDGVIRMFEPRTNHLTQQISAKKNQGQFDSFLAIGFGGSGTDLAKQWMVTFQGMEQVNDGKKKVSVAKLDLVAKDADAKKMFSHITIWIDPVLDVSLKQQFFQPSGDIQTATYTNLRYNDLKTADIGAFAIKTDKKTTVDNH